MKKATAKKNRAKQHCIKECSFSWLHNQIYLSGKLWWVVSWSSEMIARKDLLFSLEGQTVHLPSPKNHYLNDICIDRDTPIASTGKSEITFVGKFNSIDKIENEMMSVRWKVFKFTYQISESFQKVPPCKKCFSDLVLMSEVQ